jgi:hypothetical protein
MHIDEEDQLLGKSIYPKAQEEEIQAAKKTDETYRHYCMEKGVKPLIAFLVVVGLLVVCSFYCTTCIFGILAFCAVTCAFIPVLNVPMWACIIILLVKGWAFTNGNLTLTWG